MAIREIVGLPSSDFSKEGGGMVLKMPFIGENNGWRKDTTLSHKACDNTAMVHPEKPGVLGCWWCQTETSDPDFFNLTIQQC